MNCDHNLCNGETKLELYDQLLIANPQLSLPSNVLAEELYNLEMSGTVAYSKMLLLYRYALARCPYSVRIWCQLADFQVRSGADWQEILDTLEAGLHSGLHRESDLAALSSKLRSCAALYSKQLLTGERGPDE